MSVIDDRYAAMGGASGILGAVLTDEQPTSNGVARYRIYEHGAIYWTVVDLVQGFGLSTQTWEIHGLIWDKYQQLGREDGLLGLPMSDENPTGDGVGACSNFQVGAIYWTPELGAHEVHGLILDKWRLWGAERSALGYPTSDESPCPDGHGAFCHFQGGGVYWTPELGAHIVQGAIYEKWSELGWEQGFLGYPVSDEESDSYGTGARSRFQGGQIYWGPLSGAHEVHGAILDEWLAIGAERSYIGRPITDEELWVSEKINSGGRRNRFERGEIDFIAGVGAAPWPNSYKFTVTSAMILNPRSRNEDTDTVSASVAVGGAPATTQTKSLGDHGLGDDVDISLSVGPISVDSNETGVAFNYVILNAGNADWQTVDNQIKNAGGKLAETGAQQATEKIGELIGTSIGSYVLPVIGSAIGYVAGWLAAQLTNILTANCDGSVAVEQALFRGQDLWNLTMNGAHGFSTIHDGTDSPAGCGSNSSYWVSWVVERA